MPYDKEAQEKPDKFNENRTWMKEILSDLFGWEKQRKAENGSKSEKTSDKRS